MYGSIFASRKKLQIDMPFFQSPYFAMASWHSTKNLCILSCECNALEKLNKTLKLGEVIGGWLTFFTAHIHLPKKQEDLL